MFDTVLNWFTHWLPLVQGFAAIASIGGAIASWRFAARARRAREEMTQNVVSAELVATLSKTIEKLSDFRSRHVNDHDGMPDFLAYKQEAAQHRQLLEDVVAHCRAAAPYMKSKPNSWSDMLSRLADAALSPEAGKIESAIRFAKLVLAELQLSAATRSISIELQ